MNHRPGAANLQSYIIPSLVEDHPSSNNDDPRVANLGGIAAVLPHGSSSSSDPPRFPMVLHAMLKAVDAQGLSYIISWQPHGRCVLVHRPAEFVAHIMARWFKQSKWSSFLRQLNIYGFERITSGPDKNAYYHPLFLRGKESLARDIPRTQVKGTGPRRPTTSEPNFYDMPPLDPYASYGKLDHHPKPEYPTLPLPASIPLMTMHPSIAYGSEPSARDILIPLPSGNILAETTPLNQALLGNAAAMASEDHILCGPSFPLSSGILHQLLLAPTNHSAFYALSERHNPSAWRDAALSETLPELSSVMGPNAATWLLERMTRRQHQQSTLAATLSAASATAAVSMAPMVGAATIEDMVVLGGHSRMLALQILAEQLQQGSLCS